MNIPDS